MRVAELTLLVLLCAALVAGAGCGGGEGAEPTPTPTATTEPTPTPTATIDGGCTLKENEEAELIALCLAGEIIAPGDLYNQVKNDLEAIRSSFGDEYEIANRTELRIEFRAPWVPACLSVAFNSTAAQQVADGRYDAWDELNNRYNVTEIELYPFFSRDRPWVTLHFGCRLHPSILAEKYEVLPDVEYAEPSGRMFLEFASHIYPRQTEAGITYLFETWISNWDFPDEYYKSGYWYFSVEDGQPAFIGHYNPYVVDNAEPIWWAEARMNIEQYDEWYWH